MKRFGLALLSILCLGVVLAQAQNQTNPAIVGGTGAYNTSPPTCTNGNWCTFQTDVNGLLKTTGSATVAGNVTVVGPAASDAPVSGAPVRIGGRAENYTAVQSGDTADWTMTLLGAGIVKPYSTPELDWRYAKSSAGGITDTADVVAQVANATARHYVTGIQVINASATVATEFVIKDGATVMWRGYLPALMLSENTVVFNTPLRGTVNTAVNIACITTGTNTYATLQGYDAP